MKDDNAKAFIMFKDWRPLFAFLAPEDAGILVNALFDFACDGKIATAEELTPECAGPYFFMIGALENNAEKWEKRRAAGKQGGIKSGEARRSKTKQNKANAKQNEANANEDEHNINININRNINIDNSNELSKRENIKEKSTKRFTPPTLDEVKNYVFEKGLTISPEHFYNYYQANGWRVGKNPMKDWKAAARSWAARDDYKPVSPAPYAPPKMSAVQQALSELREEGAL